MLKQEKNNKGGNCVKQYNPALTRALAKQIYNTIINSPVHQVNVAKMCRELAQHQPCSHTSIRRAFENNFRARLPPLQSSIFKFEFEISLAFICMEMSLRRESLSKSDVIEMANIARLDVGKTVSKNWFYGWKNRFSEMLSYGVHGYSDPKRTSLDLIKHTRLFYKVIKAFSCFVHWNPDFIVNADEIRFNMIQNSTHTSLVTDRYLLISPVSKTNGDSMSVIPFVTASGTVLMIVHILPFKSKTNTPKRRIICRPVYKYNRKDPALHRCYIFTNHGWVTKEAWRQILLNFIKVTKPYFFGQICCLLLDRLAAHMDVDLIKISIQSCVHTLFFPAKSTHFLQPLDGKPFGWLKAKYYELKDMINCSSSSKKAASPNIQDLVMNAEYICLTKKAIVSSFKDTGLVPLQKIKIIGNAEMWSSKKKIEKTKKPIETQQQHNITTLKSIVTKVVETVTTSRDEKIQQLKQQRTSARYMKNQLITDIELIDFSESRKSKSTTNTQKKRKQQSTTSKFSSTKRTKTTTRKRGRPTKSNQKKTISNNNYKRDQSSNYVYNMLQ